MAELRSPRRSGRKRQANRKYSVDLLGELQGLGSDSDNNEKFQNPADATKEDNEFAIEQENDVEYTEDHDGVPHGSGNISLAEKEEDEDEEDEEEEREGEGEEGEGEEGEGEEEGEEKEEGGEEEGGGGGEEEEEGEEGEDEEEQQELENDDDAEDAKSDADANEVSHVLINDRGSDPLSQSTPTEKNSRYQMRAKKDPKNSVRSRGLIELSSKNPNKEDMLKFMAGGHPRDWVDFLRTKDRWLTDPTLPTKADAKKGKEGMCHHFSHTKEKREMEATIGWDWYYDQGGRELFAKRQRTQILTPDEGRGYIPKPLEQSHKFLMGPYGNQKLFRLQTGHSMYLDDAWKSAREPNQESIQPGEVRDGWILNLGTLIKCLDWATNQDGDRQYLAVVTAQPKPSRFQALSEVSPAYTPSAPLRSCVQIWEFLLGNNLSDHETLRKGPKKPPTLQLVICTEWGDIKQLKWCQVPRTFRDNDFAADKVPLGLLAGVWSDGLVRVLDVSLDKHKAATASYVKYVEPAFKAWAPNTLCTCVTWLSASMIAVGFANGFLAIWDISQENSSTSKSTPTSSHSPSSPPTPTTHHPPPPWLYTPLHQTYILALTSAYPISPHILSTSSIDGFTRLTDLRSPTTEVVLSSRSRNTSSILSFSPHTLSMLSTEENDFARLFPIRSFHTNVVFARVTASPLSLAANQFHPCVLIGCADGSLLATNPLPRVCNRKWAYYQQVVFRQEWMRGRRGERRREGRGGEATREAEGEGKGDGEGVIIRITESFKIIQTDKQKQNHKSLPLPPPSGTNSANTPSSQAPQQATKKLPSAPAPAPAPALPPLTTIFEEETGITQVCWNPNLKWGGWMAAGMGSGGVRVQDLGV